MNQLDPRLPLRPEARWNHDDTFSPALRQEGRLYYWPNITFATRRSALDRAAESIARLSSPEEMREWNVWLDTTDPMD